MEQQFQRFGSDLTGFATPKVTRITGNVDLRLKHRSKLGVFLKRKIVVICPVKDESWILDKFLTAASLFADHIVVLDHQSTDNSREIASRFAKVDLIEYTGTNFDENIRRRMLLERARDFGQGNVIFALDADEFLTLDVLSRHIQERIHSAPPGTRFRVPLANLRPGLEEFWAEKMDPIALVDDGSNFDHDSEIHFPRLPVGSKPKIVDLPNVFLMHLQYADWNRMRSKRRWYMAWERINYPSKSAIRILRRYNHMNVVHTSQTELVPSDWLSEYKKHGVTLSELSQALGSYRWDAIVRQWIQEGKVNDWHLLLGETDLQALGLRVEGQKLIDVSRQERYLSLTAAIYSRRRYLLWRIVLRVMDEIASRMVLR